MIIQRLLFLLVLPLVVIGALVESKSCRISGSSLNIDKLLIDVALDEQNNKLKFFINTKIIDQSNSSNMLPIITDVNTTTNKFSTFHATLYFQGQMIKDENKRLCEILGVKNTSSYLQSPRFKDGPSTNTTIIINPNLPFELGNSKSKRESPDIIRRDDSDIPSLSDDSNYSDSFPSLSTSLPDNYNFHKGHKFNDSCYNKSNSFASSNESISELFNNSTGQLIGCPLYVNDSVYIYYEVDIREQYGDLGSFSARFAFISNDESSTLMGCNTVYVTPKLKKSYSNAILIGVVLLIIVTGVINFLTITCSSYQESRNPFVFIASTICNENLLKQLDATVQRIILYLQFALFIAGLNINFPGFYQPLLGFLKWIALLGFTIVRGEHFYSFTEQDNIYLTYNGGGINSLAYFGNFSTLGANWWNFILTLIIWIFIQIGGQALFVSFQSVRNVKTLHLTKTKFVSFLKRCTFFVIGVFLNNFMILFAYPFLVLTLYLFYIDARSEYNNYPNIPSLKSNAFNRNVSYDNLFTPTTYVSYIDGRDNHTISVQVDGDFQTINTSYQLLYGNTTNGFNFRVLQDKTDHKSLIAPIVVAGICLSCWIIIALYFIFKYLFKITKNFRIKANKNVYKLYTSVNNLLVWGYFYHHYAPSKNYFAVIDIACLFLRSIIVSLLQSSGLAQVVCMIILELTSLMLMILIDPFYLRITWTTTRWMIPVARLLVCILCIPFLTQLNYSENVRTNVAITHLIIHLIIAVVFVCQLIYCFTITIISIVKFQKDKHKATNNLVKLTNKNSIDDFNKQFEYQPLDKLLKPIAKFRTHNFDFERDKHDYGYPYKQQLFTDSPRSRKANSVEDINNADLYFRAKAENVLRTQDSNVPIDNSSIISDNESFAKQQDDSKKRRRKNDYTTREGDLIYKKYMINDEIDPEIKALWESRNGGNLSDSTHKEESDLESLFKSEISKDSKIQPISSFLSRLTICKSKKEEFEKGFQVSRPKQLIVKKLPLELDTPTVEEERITRNVSLKTAKTTLTSSTGFTSTTVGISPISNDSPVNDEDINLAETET